MTRTANASYPDKIACLIWLAAEAGHPFICPECGKPILPDQVVHFDHRQAVGRGGANTFKDLRPVHAARRGTEDAHGNPLDCHDRKTFRPRSLATTIGGDNYEAKKTTRLEEARAAKPAPTRAWTSRKLSAGRKFPPRGSRPMNRRRRA